MFCLQYNQLHDSMLHALDCVDDSCCTFLQSAHVASMCVDKQHLMAVGDAAGTLHILAIPWSLRQPTPNEVRQHILSRGANYSRMAVSYDDETIRCGPAKVWKKDSDHTGLVGQTCGARNRAQCSNTVLPRNDFSLLKTVHEIRQLFKRKC